MTIQAKKVDLSEIDVSTVTVKGFDSFMRDLRNEAPMVFKMILRGMIKQLIGGRP